MLNFNYLVKLIFINLIKIIIKKEQIFKISLKLLFSKSIIKNKLMKNMIDVLNN